ncbi:efflux RND transporter periplasmic adaptor subunit [Muricauda sp. JGD-17]|uniref:Efflux RND transporter periplasmic adaptor subunit n=1 Tax=Flagellimonas ochracea TaxID=2696472 RepID=A0A964TAT8_9FLAO|nr:efflux RND transporter periplasmic adaptor subunit [Allomuricauda ochracea]NAY91445.1 efflux RND transporter periplasmic adaptor subunit [Allomuricauda ochracea]
MKNIFFYFLSAFLLLLMGCGNEKKQYPSQEHEILEIRLTQEQFNTNNFQLGTLEKKTFPKMVETSGIIDVPPQNKAVITAFMGGFVKKTLLLVGDKVKKGQALITLENQEFVKMQQEYLGVYNQLDFLKVEYTRNKTLFEENITSEKKYLEAKSNYETSLAKYEGLKKQLQMLNISPKNVEQLIITSEAVIYSPIDGSITKMNVSTGSYVAPSTEMLEIVDNNHVHLELTVFEKDILKVKKGQKIQFEIPESSEDPYTATVYLVGTSIDDAKRTIKVHGHLDNENNNFLPGMFVNAHIMTDVTQVWSLPVDAVTSSEGISYLLKLVSNQEDNLIFQKVSVTTGSTFKDYIEIKPSENIKPEDQFLVKGVFGLLGN